MNFTPGTKTNNDNNNINNSNKNNNNDNNNNNNNDNNKLKFSFFRLVKLVANWKEYQVFNRNTNKKITSDKNDHEIDAYIESTKAGFKNNNNLMQKWQE